MDMTKDESREPPISFRPGKLRIAIQQRTARLGEGQVVKRDLARYYLMIGQALLDIRLTRREARWLIENDFHQAVEDAMSQDPFIPEHRDPSEYLLGMVRRAIRKYERKDKPAPDLAYAMREKLEAMSPLEHAALLDALDRLPIENEEDIYDPGNWALIGIPLADDPLTADDVVRKSNRL